MFNRKIYENHHIIRTLSQWLSCILRHGHHGKIRNNIDVDISIFIYLDAPYPFLELKYIYDIYIKNIIPNPLYQQEQLLLTCSYLDFLQCITNLINTNDTRFILCENNLYIAAKNGHSIKVQDTFLVNPPFPKNNRNLIVGHFTSIEAMNGPTGIILTGLISMRQALSFTLLWSKNKCFDIINDVLKRHNSKTIVLLIISIDQLKILDCKFSRELDNETKFTVQLPKTLNSIPYNYFDIYLYNKELNNFKSVKEIKYNNMFF